MHLTVAFRAGLILIAAFTIAGVASSACAQEVTVVGIVTDAADSAPVVDATVRITGAPWTFTNREGRFIVEGVRPGRTTIAIEALGYEPFSRDITIRGDTLLRITLGRDPLRLEGVEVRGVTIRGELYDRTTGRRVYDGEIVLQPDGRRVSARHGNFTMRNVPTGPVRLVARVIEYLPEAIEFDATADTTLRFDMRIDSVGIRLIQRQVRRLEQRAEAEPYRVRALNRDDIARAGAPDVAELIRRNLPIHAVPQRPPYDGMCVIYNDARMPFEMLIGMPPELVERIEVLGFDGAMIRVYSKRYVAGLMRRTKLPTSMFL